MKPVDDLSRSLVAFDQESAVVAVIELSNASWLVAGTLPGVARRPLKKLDPDPAALEHLLTRWRGEGGLAKSGNARVRRGLIQLAWRFLMFQKGSALARWYRCRTEGAAPARRKTMIVALARKLLIAFWRLVTTGSVPDGMILRAS
jgi:hypothetical protein